jgi:YD repeat-containing protein
MVRGRSYVPLECMSLGPGQDEFALIPRVYYPFVLISRSISGAGVSTQSWAYAYSPPNESYISDCKRACTSTVWTDVTDPDNRATRYTFSNKFDVTEGQLQTITYYSGKSGTTSIRTETYSYADPVKGAWPTLMGEDLQERTNSAQNEQLSPLQHRMIQQDGKDTYNWLAEDFNSFAQPTAINRFSSTSRSLTNKEKISYLNDLPHWVLGLPLQADDVGSRLTIYKNDYDLSNVTLTRRWSFGQPVMSYTYNSQGQLGSFTDGNDYMTRLDDYKLGIPQTIGYADGTRETLTVDDLGQITSITDQAGSTTRYGYDSAGRLASITYPAGDEIGWHPQSFTYDFITSAERGIGAGHWRRTASKGDARTVTYFDAMLRPILSDTYINGNANSHISTRTDYDWKGQKTFVSYPISGALDLGAISGGTFTDYDALGRPIAEKQSSELGLLTTRIDYVSDIGKRVTDPKGNITLTKYQAFDQPGYDKPLSVQQPEGVNQTITRDVFGKPTAIRQWGSANGYSADLTKTFYYDSYQRLCRIYEPESGSTVMAYDDANNLDWIADGVAITVAGCGREQVADAAKTFHTYDSMNRLTVLEPPVGTDGTTYTYDALGNVKHSRTGIAHWSGDYNKLSMLVSETLAVNGFSNTLRYAHDSYGSLSLIQYPDGTTVDYAPDALGRATKAGNFASGVSYHPDGDIAHFTLGSGADHVVEKNARQLQSHFSYIKGDAFHVSEDLAYDPNGNVTAIADLVNGQRSKTLGYDGLDRLAQAQAPALWGAESYRYDPLNNLRNRIDQVQSSDYNYDAANRLVAITRSGGQNSSFGYDTRGNTVLKNGNALVFDGKNQLVNVPGFANYAYNAEGRRVLKQPAHGGDSTYYFYAQDGRLLYQYDEDMAAGTSYVYLGNKLIASNVRSESAVHGHIDGVAVDADDNAVINGWACSTGMSQSIQVHMYLGGPYGRGTFMGASAANQASEPAVAAACGVSGGSFRFSIPLSASVRSEHVDEKIYIYGISPVGGDNTELGNSGEFMVPAERNAPGAPAVNAEKTADGMGAVVTWSAPNGVTSSIVQQQFNEGHWTQVYQGAATSYTLHPAPNGTYAFRVHSCNAYGCGDWGQSGHVHFANVPNTPPSISVPGASYSPVPVTWVASTNATTYSLEQSINGGGWNVVYDGGDTGAHVAAHVSGSYVYRVRACNTYGCSDYATSSAVAVTAPPAHAPSLSAPANNNTGSYTVSWTGVGDATRYTLQEQVNGGDWYTVRDDSATSWDTGGRGNAIYGYRVVACNDAGCGPWSGTVHVTVTLVPAVPTGAYIESRHPNPKSYSYVAHWNAMPGATHYEVVRWNDNRVVYSGPDTSNVVESYVSNNVELLRYDYQVRACNNVGCSALTILYPDGGPF